MDFDDAIKLLTVIFLFLIFISTACIAESLEEIAINETNENCVEVNKEIYCKE